VSDDEQRSDEEADEGRNEYINSKPGRAEFGEVDE
jgi:hypothetical protein